jgi:hypothetical protein
LVFKDNREKLRKNVDYYLLTREVWDFFFNIYGGGPAIVMNNRDDNSLSVPSEKGNNKYEV